MYIFDVQNLTNINMKKLMKFTVIFLAIVGISTIVKAQNNEDNAYPENGQYPTVELNKSADGNKSADFCDDFNVPNTPTLTGWTVQSGSWEILNNSLYHPSGSGDVITVDGSDAVDGLVTATALYEGVAGVRYMGLVGRYNAGGQHILFKIQDNASAGFWDSYFVYIPSTGSLILTGQNFGTDPIIQLEYVGADITIRIDIDKDGTWDHTNSTTTTYLDSGLSGLEAYGEIGADDFCTGPVAPPAVPLSTWGLFLAFIGITSFVFIRKMR